MKGVTVTRDVSVTGDVTEALLLSKPDIAALARVRRPVVTMWIARYRRSSYPFPAPVATTDRVERYRATEVVDWLRARGLGNSDTLVEDLAVHAALGHRSALREDTVLDGLTALLCAKVLLGAQLSDFAAEDLLDEVDELDPDDEYLFTEIEALGGEIELLAGYVDHMSDAAYTPAQAFETLMDRRFRLGLRDLSETMLRPAALDLVARIAVAVSAGDESVFVDPSVNGSDLLVALRSVLPEYSEPVAVCGYRDAASSRLARRRVTVNEWQVRTVPAGDVGVPGPATFVTQFPPPGSSGMSDLEILTAIDDIALQMRAGQVAVVVGPASALVDPLADRAAESIRSTLLRDDRVRAALRLPEGLLVSRPGLSTAVWVLGDADGSIAPAERWTVLADLRGVELDGQTADGLVHDVTAAMGAWESLRAHAFRFGSVYKTATLLAQGSLMLPRPRATPRAAATAAEMAGRVGEHVTAANAVASRLDPWLTVPVEYHAAAPALTVSAGTLADARDLKVVSGNRIDPLDIVDVGTENEAGIVRVIGADEVLGRRAAGSRGVDRLSFTTAYPSGRYTEPGDVVFCTSPEFGVFVDTLGSSAVLYPARVLRVVDPRVSGLVPELIARHLTSTGVGARTSGAVRGARPWRTWQIPRIPPDAVAAVTATLDELRRRRQAAAELLGTLDALAGTLVDGVSRGVLTVTADSGGTNTDDRPGPVPDTDHTGSDTEKG